MGWVLSNEFQINNGVRLGGILSPVLFGVHKDGLLEKLVNAKVGCFIGNAFLGVLVCADDLALVAPTPFAMRKLLSFCDTYSYDYSVSFNDSKSKCLHSNGGMRFS
jgi:Reverse transcriptase (RNA-dependent DNA polymerase)